MIYAFVQARTSSTRLPGKVLRLIEGEPMIRRVIERVKRIKGVDQVVLLTSTEASDDRLSIEANATRIQLYRGSLHDVAQRFIDAAIHFNLQGQDVIMRLTADCPLLDPDVAESVLRVPRPGANTKNWPDGLDVEVFTVGMLLDKGMGEHVTPLMKFDQLPMPGGENLRHLKWSVDTEEDLEFANEVYRVLGDKFTWEDVLELRPEDACEACHRGDPARLIALGSISGPRERVVPDLHEVFGAGLVECTGWGIRAKLV
jgi:spore coat polysaccharide biosynthesis protein SpsF